MPPESSLHTARPSRLATLVALATTLAPAAAALGGGSIADGELDLLVYFAYDEPVEASWAQEYAAWEPVFGEFSLRLFDATERQLQLGTVTFTERDELARAADVWITDGAAGSSGHLDGFGRSGRHITLSQVHRSISGAVLGQFALLHEAGHYLFGLHDEYQGQLGTDPSTVADALHYCSAIGGEGPGSVMDGGSSLAPAHLRSEFCTAFEHNAGQVAPDGTVVLTRQQALHGVSCWERMVASGVGGLTLPLEPGVPDVNGHLPISFEALDGPPAIVLVLDRSGSMGAGLLEPTKQAAMIGVGLLSEEVDLALVSFASAASVDLDLAPASELHKLDALASIDVLEAAGSTATGLALLAASSELAGFTGGARAIVLLSDGGNTASPPPVAPEVIDPLVASGTVVYTIGLGAAFNAAELTEVAERTGGRFVAAQDAAQLPAIFAEVFADATGAEVARVAAEETIAAGATESLAVEVGADATRLQVSLGFTDGAPVGLTLDPPGPAPPIDALAFLADPGVDLFVSGVQQVLTVADPVPGTWVARVESSSTLGTHGYDLSLLTTTPAVDVTAAAGAGQFVWPEPIRLSAAVTAGFPVGGAAVTARVRRPDGTTVPGLLTLHDDGQAIHGDELAGDGVYGALFQDYWGTPADDGSYTFMLEVVSSGGAAANATEAGGVAPGGAPSFRVSTTVSATVQNAPVNPVGGALDLVDPELELDGQVLGEGPVPLSTLLAARLTTGSGEPVDLARVDVNVASDGGLAALGEFALHLDEDEDGLPDNPAQPLDVVSGSAVAGGLLSFRRSDGEPLVQLAPDVAPNLLVVVGQILVPPDEPEDPPAEGGVAGFAVGPHPPVGTGAAPVLIGLALLAMALRAALRGGLGSRPRTAATLGLAGTIAVVVGCSSGGGGGGPGTVAPPAATAFTLTLEPSGVQANAAIGGGPIQVGGATLTVDVDF